MASTYPIRFASQMREHLRALRKKQGLTQAQLGAQLGVSQARIAEIEANPGLVSFEQLLQLLSHLGSGLVLETEARNPDSWVWPKFVPSQHEFRPQVAEGLAHYESGRSKTSSADSLPKKSKDTVFTTTARSYNFSKKKGSW